MGDRIAAMTAASIPLASQVYKAKNSAALSLDPQILNTKKTSPHLIIDFTECALSLSKKPLKDI